MSHPTSVKASLLATSSLTVMAGAILGPSLPAIGVAFGDPEHRDLRIKLILTLPALTIALTAPLSGLVIDHFGRVRTLIVGLLLYAAAGTSGLYLESLNSLLVGRAVLGVAVACVMTASTTLLGDLFHDEQRSAMMSAQAAAMTFGGVIFLIGGGQLAALHWRGPFVVYAAAAVMAPLVAMTLKEPERPGHTDAESGTLIPPEDGEPGGPVPWGRIIASYVTGCLGMAMFYLVPVQIPFLLEALSDAGGRTIGFAIACITMTAGIASLYYRAVKRHMGFASIFALLFAGQALAYAVIGTAASLPVVILGLLLGGFGGGMLMPNVNLSLLTAAPPRLRGKLVGGLTASLFLGQFLSPILAEPILRWQGPGATFLVAGVLMAIMAAIFAAVAHARPRRR